MALGREAVRGALFTISTGMGSRAIGLVGTLVITHFVGPTEYGEVMVAAILVLTANQLSTAGLGQYIVAKPQAPASAVFHATVFHLLLGAAALVLLFVLAPTLGVAVEAPGMTRFLPGLVLAAVLDRIAFVPERVLARELRFGVLSAARAGGDLAHTFVSVGLAALGWGAMAIVVGNLARALTRLASFVWLVDWRIWLEPCRITMRQTRELFAFGLPIAFAAVCQFASRRWDGLLMSRFFGPGVAGAYNLAYNLADVPATQVGEHIGDVLLPSFARMDRQRQVAALVRSLTMLGLVVFPMAVGLAVVAPTLVAAIFDERWQSVAPMLVLLSGLSVTRPIGWTIASYLQARGYGVHLTWLEGFKLVCLVGGIAAVGGSDPLWACGAVGFAFGAHAVGSLFLARRLDGIPVARLIGGLGGVLAACAIMAGAVLVVRATFALDERLHPAAAVAVEVLLGAVVYVAAAFGVARAATREFVSRVVDAVSARRGRPAPERP